MLMLDNLRMGGAFRWKTEDRRLERSKNVMWKASTSKVISPPVLVKD
jgi:hypothetical protein